MQLRAVHSPETDKFYMYRALQLAIAQDVRTSPNPMVGAVLVAQDRILAEGAFREDGGPHAEVDALGRLREEDRILLPEATLYVNLEPCSITGRTPPCADRLVREGLGRVLVGAIDFTPGVCGAGLAKLRRGGIELAVGVAQAAAVEVNRKRKVFVTQHRPYIILKQAVSSDGYIGRTGQRLAITGTMAQMLSHQWRGEVDAILVGKNTFTTDYPLLDVRLVQGRSPAVIIFDPNASSDQHEAWQHLLSHQSKSESRRTIFWATAMAAEKSLRAPAGVEILSISRERPIQDMLTQLYTRRIGSLLVEGGAQVLKGFAETRLWDEYRCLRSKTALAGTSGTRIAAAQIDGDFVQSYAVGQDHLEIYRIGPQC